MEPLPGTEQVLAAVSYSCSLQMSWEHPDSLDRSSKERAQLRMQVMALLHQFQLHLRSSFGQSTLVWAGGAEGSDGGSTGG